VAQNEVVRVLPGGSDPENFDVSKDGKQLFISNEDASAVSIVDIASGTVLKTIKRGGQPEGVQVAPDGKRVFITSEEDGTVAVLDLAVGHIISTFKVGHRPRSIAFMPDGSRAYVNAENDRTVVLVDAAKFETLKAISLGKHGLIQPMARCFPRRDQAVHKHVPRAAGPQGRHGDSDRSRFVTVGKPPWSMALSPDAKTLYSANGPSNDISVVNLADNTVVATIPAGTGPGA
jgi:YVTN family beta-propeller protein